MLLGDEEAFFSKDIPSKGSLKSTVSRSYRSRDKGSYGDSHQDDIDTYRREMKRQAPSTTDESRQTEHRHGNRRRDDEGRHHGRSVEHKSKRKSRKETSNQKRERRTRSRSPIYSTQPRSHSDRRETRPQYSHSDSQSKSHSGCGLVHTDMPTHTRASTTEKEEGLAAEVTSIVLLEISSFHFLIECSSYAPIRAHWFPIINADNIAVNTI